MIIKFQIKPFKLYLNQQTPVCIATFFFLSTPNPPYQQIIQGTSNKANHALLISAHKDYILVNIFRNVTNKILFDALSWE